MPLVVAHTVTDAVVLVGCPLMPGAWWQTLHLR